MFNLFDAQDSPSDPITRPTTPLLPTSRTLRRTISLASIDTVCPPSTPKKGIRRSIDEIAESQAQKKASNKKKHKRTHPRDGPPTTESADKTTAPESESKKTTKKGAGTRKSPLGDASHRETNATATTGTGFRFSIFNPGSLLGWKPEFGIDQLLFGDDGDDDDGLFAQDRGASTFHPPEPATVDDVRLAIESSKVNVTIWDGLDADHHVFKCRLLLKCTTRAFDTVLVPDITRVEMDCFTRPPGAHLAKPPTLQATYLGATPNLIATTDDGQPKVALDAGIHMDRTWSKVLNLDLTWGWYRNVFVPLSPRLFDKVEYREFKLVSRVWVGEECMEDELTFGISMLIRGVDME